MADSAQSVKEILQLLVTRVLTSPGDSTVGAGLGKFGEIVHHAAGKSQLNSGGGRPPPDVGARHAAGALAVHCSSKTAYAQSFAVDENQVRALRQVLDEPN